VRNKFEIKTQLYLFSSSTHHTHKLSLSTSPSLGYIFVRHALFINEIEVNEVAEGIIGRKCREKYLRMTGFTEECVGG
jgi:hypothetical protein